MTDNNTKLVEKRLDTQSDIEEDVKDTIEAVTEISLEEAKSVIEYNAYSPKIKMDDSFYEQPLKEQADYMHKLANAMNHAAKLMQDERNALLEVVEVSKQSVANADQAVSIQKIIAAKALEQLNTHMQENAIRTGHLQDKIRTLETIVKAAGLSID
jgi:hypothetical protein